MASTTRGRLLTLGFAAIVAVGGCSSDTEESSSTTTTAPPTTTTVAEQHPLAGTTTGSIESAGLEREYVLVVPSGYDGSSALPLVFLFHGYTMNASAQLSESRFGSLAEEEGFVVIAPEGRGDIQRWLFELDAVDVDVTESNPDIALVGDLLSYLTTELSIDPDRVYAAGFSNGGWMASAVVCAYADSFAAVSPVAGLMDFGSDCKPSQPVPMITFHGIPDGYEPFEGGVENAPLRSSLPTDLGGTYDELPMAQNPMHDASIPEKTEMWASRNGCDAPAAEAVDDVTEEVAYRCAASAPVVLYAIADGSHWWGISSASTVETNEAMFAFFAEAAS